ncbi:MAG: PEP-CTERM sorting domain-containing protein [Okeania sp. SIO2H7]|nr:PEP-CTERM sorting domain-containing protein [Okeania sp. SIO2H7]
MATNNWKKTALAKVGGAIAATSALLVGFATETQAALLFDRGLPTENLNDISGPDRSNIRLATDLENLYFYGDDFTIGAEGETYKVDTIRTWVVPAFRISFDNAGDPEELGDLFESVTLFTGAAEDSDISARTSATLNTENNLTSNPDVTLTKVTYPNTDSNFEVFPDRFDDFVDIWQIDFNHLNWTIEGGKEYRFGVRGVGRSILGFNSFFFPWYNHGSNAGLSGSPQDGADNMFFRFDARGNFIKSIDTGGLNWDKSSDINIQVFGDLVSSGDVASTPEPAAIFGLLTVSVLGVVLKVKRNK